MDINTIISKEEKEEFEKIFEETEGFAGYNTNTIFETFPDHFNSFTIEKRKRFKLWFYKKGIEEEWLFDEW